MTDLFKEVAGIDSQDIIGGKPQLTIWKMDIDMEPDEPEDDVEPTGFFVRMSAWITSHFK